MCVCLFFLGKPNTTKAQRRFQGWVITLLPLEKRGKELLSLQHSGLVVCHSLRCFLRSGVVIRLLWFTRVICCLNKEWSYLWLLSSDVLRAFVVVVAAAAVFVNMYKGRLPNELCARGVVCWARPHGSQYCSAVSRMCTANKQRKTKSETPGRKTVWTPQHNKCKSKAYFFFVFPPFFTQWLNSLALI